MDVIYEQSYTLDDPISKTDDVDSSGPLDSYLKVGLVISISLLILLIVLTLAAKYS